MLLFLLSVKITSNLNRKDVNQQQQQQQQQQQLQ